jgi:Fur family transcriptional regulator, ferric uptake regulator
MNDSMQTMLEDAGIEPTPNRVLVLTSLGERPAALTAGEILRYVRARRALNKVTLYRTLELFVERGLVLKHSSGDRAFRYCLGGKRSGAAHCHAYCRLCGRMECIPAAEAAPTLGGLKQSLLADVENVEIRIDGICGRCLADRGRERVDGPCGNH